MAVPLPSDLLISNQIADAFSTATLSIIDSSIPPQKSQDQSHKITAYYRDSSGRACVPIRTRLEFDTIDNGVGADSFLSCINPHPVEVLPYGGDTTSQGGGRSAEQEADICADEASTNDDQVCSISSQVIVDNSFSFECFIVSTGETTKQWVVEQVTILGSQIERTDSLISALLFDIEVVVRGNGVRKEKSTEILEDGELNLCAVLSQREKCRDNNHGTDSSPAHALMKRSGDSALAAGLLGLELGGGILSPETTTHRNVKLEGVFSSKAIHTPNNPMEMHYGTKIIRTRFQTIQVTLVPPLKLTVREVCSARTASGSTLVEIILAHSSEWHKKNITVTGMAFHPGQSRLCGKQNDPSTNIAKQSAATKSIQGGELSVIDMSRRVRWGFCPGTAPQLPLVLGPHEAFATVIQIDASEDVRSRVFLSPLSVHMITTSEESKGCSVKDREKMMLSTDVRWTTSRVAVENSDAFKVDMSLRGGSNTSYCVGAPVIVSLRVLNLSVEPRELMLFVAKDGENIHADAKKNTMLHNRAKMLGQQNEDPFLKENKLLNTAVVSEVNGYTFGVWGLSDGDDGTTRYHRDHDLLAIDAALLLGEVKGQRSVDAELRFIPLREGTLDVPHLKLYDKRAGRWYSCIHTLKIVAASKT